MSASCDISGFLKGMADADGKVPAAAVRAMAQFGEHVLGDAQVLAPVKTGALKASGATEPAELAGANVTKLIGFNTDYAAAVHEVLDAHHPQGQAKYLETAVQNNAPKMNPFIAERLKSAV